MPPSASRPSVVVAGGGHNGLVCAAYLAAAGLDVEVLEARESVGGCASTVEAVGARVNVCNCDHTMIRRSGVVEELDLGEYGLRYLELEPTSHAVVVGAGPGWWSFADPGRTLESLSLTHPSQVEGYRRYLEVMVPLAELVLSLAAAPPTFAALCRRAGPTSLRLFRLARASAVDVLRSFFTDEALIAPCAAMGPAVWGLDPAWPGTGLGALGYALRHLAPPGRPVGGSGSLPAALRSAIEASGGRVRTGAQVTGVRCAGRRVTGVELDTGEIVPADAVVCATDPRTVFVDWVGTGAGGAAEKVARRWEVRPTQDGYESKLDAVIDAVPRFIADDEDAAARLGVRAGIATTVITPPVAEIGRARTRADEGGVADQPVMLANLPSVADSSMMAANGGHVFSLEVLFTPYRLAGGWSQSAEPQRWLSVFGRHVAPGFAEGVGPWRAVTPPDYERDFGLRRGHAPSFGGGPLAALVGKDRELTRYETPVRGLFLTGAGTFPGAGIWGASGRNAASVVVAHLGLGR